MPWLSSYGFCLNMLPTKVISLRCYPCRRYSSCAYYTLTITIYHWCSSSLQHLWVWCYPLNWHRDRTGGGTKFVLAIQGSRCTMVFPYHWWLCNPCNIPYISRIMACACCLETWYGSPRCNCSFMPDLRHLCSATGSTGIALLHPWLQYSCNPSHSSHWLVPYLYASY